jgi:hypothetical protein
MRSCATLDPAPSAMATLLATVTTSVKVASWLIMPKMVLLGAMAARGRSPRWPMQMVSTMPRSGSAMAAAAHVATCGLTRYPP